MTMEIYAETAGVHKPRVEAVEEDPGPAGATEA